MKTKTCLLILLPLLLAAFNFSDTIVFAQSSPIPPWELIKEQGPLKVYTRKSEDSDIKELRITTQMKATLNDFIEALNDADSYKEWVYKCASSRLVERISDFELYYQVESDFPFPLSDRDLVVYTIQKIDASGTFHSDSVARPDYQPKEKGVVRISLFESHWKVTALGDGTVFIDYNSKVDPAGNIPLWVINLGLTIGPVKTMESFTEFVEQKKFKR